MTYDGHPYKESTPTPPKKPRSWLRIAWEVNSTQVSVLPVIPLTLLVLTAFIAYVWGGMALWAVAKFLGKVLVACLVVVVAIVLVAMSWQAWVEFGKLNGEVLKRRDRERENS